MFEVGHWIPSNWHISTKFLISIFSTRYMRVKIFQFTMIIYMTIVWACVCVFFFLGNFIQWEKRRKIYSWDFRRKSNCLAGTCGKTTTISRAAIRETAASLSLERERRGIMEDQLRTPLKPPRTSQLPIVSRGSRICPQSSAHYTERCQVM